MIEYNRYYNKIVLQMFNWIYLWLEKKLGNETFQKVVIGIAVFMGLGLSVLLFFLLPMIVSGFFDQWIPNTLVLNLIEGLIRIVVFIGTMPFYRRATL